MFTVWGFCCVYHPREKYFDAVFGLLSPERLVEVIEGREVHEVVDTCPQEQVLIQKQKQLCPGYGVGLQVGGVDRSEEASCSGLRRCVPSCPRSFCHSCLYVFFSLLIFIYWFEREREKCQFVVPVNYTFITKEILVCGLTGDQTHNLGVSGQCPNQLSYLAQGASVSLFSRGVPVSAPSQTL